MEDESKAIKLPASLVRRIEEKIKDSNYTSVSEYIEEVINTVLTAEEMEVALFSSERRKEIRKKLKDLGYLE